LSGLRVEDAGGQKKFGFPIGLKNAVIKNSTAQWSVCVLYSLAHKNKPIGFHGKSKGKNQSSHRRQYSSNIGMTFS